MQHFPNLTPVPATSAKSLETNSKKFFSRVSTNRESAFDVEMLPGVLTRDFSPVWERVGQRRALVVTTPTVARLYPNILGSHAIVLPCTESTKTLSQVETVCAKALSSGLDRSSVLIALGGGICSDLVTMAASWLRRGIATIRVPTTLVAQIDAALGIKAGLNFLGKKSSLGCFYPPESVLIDPRFLESLPDRHLRAGFAEILKLGLTCDGELFEATERAGASLIASGFTNHPSEGDRLLWLAVSRMLEQLEPNFYEDRTYQRLVDFGHLVSPLLEVRSSYTISHGEAVAIDMTYSCILSHQLGLLSKNDLLRILDCFHALGLPQDSDQLNADLIEEALVDAAAHRGGKVNLVLPTAIGHAVFVANRDQVPKADLVSAIRNLKRLNRTSENGRSIQEIAARTHAVKVEQSCLVFDIGGTNLRCGHYDSATRSILSSVTRGTPSHYTSSGDSRAKMYDLLLRNMHEMGHQVFGSVEPRRICIAFAGPLDVQGRVLAAPTIWADTPSDPINLRADLQRLWPGAHIDILNDVTAAGYRYCKRQGTDSFCIVTVSSGIGNKIFIDGKPCVGSSCRGGEIGHVQVDFTPNASVCECGGRGHLGAIASGRGTVHHVRKVAAACPDAFQRSIVSTFATTADAIMSDHVVAAYLQMDPFIIEIIRETARPLANNLATIHAAMGLERFIIIGGFALAMGEQYRRLLVELAGSSCWSLGQDWESMLELGAADGLSGLIGGGRYTYEFAPQFFG